MLCIGGRGLKLILVVNGHGCNMPVRIYLQEVKNTLPDLRLNWYDRWLSSSVEADARKHNLKALHANWLEVFSFAIVGNMSDGTKTWPKVIRAILHAKTARRRVYFLGFSRSGWTSGALAYQREINKHPVQGENWESIGLRLVVLDELDDNMTRWTK